VHGERMPFPAAVRELERLATEFPGEPVIQVALCVNRALGAYASDRREEGWAFATEGLDASRRIGATVFTALHTAIFGYLSMLGGDLAGGERLVLAGIRELRAYDERLWLSWVLVLLASIRVEQGRSAEALVLADEAEQQGRHDRRTIIAANTSRARAHVRLGAIHEAKAAARKAVALADTTDSLFQRAHAHYALAEVLVAAEEMPAALAAAEEAGGLYRALERTFWAQRAKALAEQIERTAHGIAPTTVG
jgi:tetratricopeptide (TPR) repeat protein